MRLPFAAALILLTAAPAFAATPDSWAALDKAARQSCEREISRLASKAKVRAVSGKVSGIGAAKDADRYYGLLLAGQTAGFRSEWLCLYDKRAKTAVAREVDRP